ncbi:MAG: FAD-dependent oxidoreductase [Verrucomicrobia bacterium]|nr:FAD-dependent oxidoreductase [Verrucomicrobiota bacterium]MCG2681422.1 FAD-dependent oxidoreductase [Kiritimatiellia bacterium]MBU4248322.1 FAD-dependent oxidoreductase [Verrucomicrobiota bacterium]MBU4289849.1 FAD-dependent oxidoreductase [Verrucomicrobiota bacterium]MBU4430320.1 FAD-dependent oxidoreductase [Verrucomicrobiota bacterium]
MEFKRNIGVIRPYDVVVCGGESAGCAGLDVLLIEQTAQLGGVFDNNKE